MPAPLQTRVHAQAPHSANVEDVTRPLNVLAEAPTPGAAIEAQATRPRVRVEIRCFFREAQGRAAAPPVPFALDATSTSTRSALLPNYGTVEKLVYAETNRGGSSLWTDSPSVSLSRPWLDAQRPHTPPGTRALVVENLGTALSSALLHSKSNPLTPYKPDAWLAQLTSFNLLERYPTLYHSLVHGFDVGILSISKTYVPPNNPSIFKHPEVYNEIMENEFRKGRYIGPFSQANLEALIGPFQSSPLSLVPKPGKPGKYRGVHDFSHPHAPDKGAISSINSNIDSHDFPCTWGTFSTVCLIIYRLPPGSQASIRDVSEAYRTIPVHHKQWPGLVVRLKGEDNFVANINNSFGLTSAGGAHGMLADAGTDIMRASGIGPVSKWVDDHIFFRIPRPHLIAYNAQRQSWHKTVTDNGGRIHEGSRLWYRGDVMPDGRPEEFDEDMFFPLRDLSSTSPRFSNDAQFTYADTDIDRVSDELGIPWEHSKTVPFSNVVPYLGFVWNLTTRTVEVPLEKKSKYRQAIEEWQKKPRHTLAEVQKLYGKLLHTTLVVPAGRAYLTNLEIMLALFNNRPFVPHTPPRDTPQDLIWWARLLDTETLSRHIPGPAPLDDLRAFSDASSGFGIGITIGDNWRAWRLLPGWKADGRDIGWAEAVGFELLVRSILSSSSGSVNLKVYGDNKGVVEGWWKGRSRNKQANLVFRRIHALMGARQSSVHTRYAPSKENPADDPSQGVYPPRSLLLPRLPIPPELDDFIVDFDSNVASLEPGSCQPGQQAPLPKPRRSLSENERAIINAELDRRGEELLSSNP